MAASVHPKSSEDRHAEDAGSPLTLLPSEHEVHVWCAALGSLGAELRSMESVLNEDELTKAAGYRVEPVRNEFVCARAILRKILSYYLEIPAPDIGFTYGAHGKPAIVADTGGKTRGLRFNLSHTHGLALCAISTQREVGIDVEHVREDIGYKEIVRQFFSPAENVFFQYLPKHAILRYFFKCWTAKEAYVKARGISLAHELERPTAPRFNIDVHATACIDIIAADGSLWSLHQLNPRPGYIGAVVIEGRGVNVKYLEISPMGQQSGIMALGTA